MASESTVTYRYEQSYAFKKKGVKHSIKEQVIDGAKGLTVMYLEKTGDDFYRMYAKEDENNKNSFELEEKKGEADEPKRTINEKELLKLLKDRKLETMINYITKERGTYKILNRISGGARKASKKASKKGSKKASKKASKTAPKKSSKKASKKSSKK